MLYRSHTACLRLFCLLMASILSGCAAPRSVVWSPDSKTLIFSTDEGGLAAIDVYARDKRRIGMEEPCWMRRPGISPKGDQIALVFVESSEEADLIQIITQDMTGHRRHQSEVFVWPASNGTIRKRVVRQASAQWSGNGKHLLLWFTSGRDERHYFARYDFAERRLTPLRDTFPAVDLFAAGMTPFREDDSGYLAIRTTPDGVQDVFFVTWEGWETHLAGRREPQLFERPYLVEGTSRPGSPPPPRPSSAGRNADLFGMSSRLPVTAGRWRLGKLQLALGRGEVELNTIDRTSQYRHADSVSKSRDALADQRVFLRVPIGTGNKFQARCRANKVGGLTHFFLEVANVENDSTLPIGRANFSDGGFCPIVPSPDGKSVAMTYADENGRVFTTVIDDQGQFRCTTQISGAGWEHEIVTDRPANVAFWNDERSRN